MRIDMRMYEACEKKLEVLENEEKALFESRGDEEWYQWFDAHYDEIERIDDEKAKTRREMIIVKATNIDVGDGISLSPYTDWDAFTVIARKDTPKGFKLIVQKDRAIRTDKNGMSECQEYRFEKDENGYTREVRWNPRGNWFSADGYRVALGRREYYDYSF